MDTSKDFKNNQRLTKNISHLTMINLISVMSLLSLNKFKDVNISDIVQSVSSKILKGASN